MSHQSSTPPNDDLEEHRIIDSDTLSEAALILRALNHELRQQILELLCTNQELTVTDIFIALRVEQSVASQHLAVLRKANLVLRQRQGKYIYYRINQDRLVNINKLVKELAFHC